MVGETLTLPSKATKAHLTAELDIATGQRDVARGALIELQRDHMHLTHIEPCEVKDGEHRKDEPGPCRFCEVVAEGFGEN